MSGLESLAISVEERSVDWRVPGAELDRCLAPDSPEALAEILGAASREETGVLVLGGGTRCALANPARSISIGLSTLGIAGIDEFEPEEGVLHAAAGTPIAEISDVATGEGWELPLDPPGARSTLGGVIATAATGPRAQTFGRVADSILGLDVAQADGTLTRCGGRVVKNVTGYDLAKLYCGSFGTLGVVTGAWLRLRPRPAARIALRAPLPSDADAFEVCRGWARRTSVRALVWCEDAADGAVRNESESTGTTQSGVFIELAGSEAEVADDRAHIESSLALESIGCERIDALRDERAAGDPSAPGEEIVLRARVVGSRTAALHERIREAGFRTHVDLGLGMLHAWGPRAAASELLALREAAARLGGVVVFESLPADLRPGLDVFGEEPGNEDLMAAVKRRFDPKGILNPGRFVAGT